MTPHPSESHPISLQLPRPAVDIASLVAAQQAEYIRRGYLGRECLVVVLQLAAINTKNKVYYLKNTFYSGWSGNVAAPAPLHPHVPVRTPPMHTAQARRTPLPLTNGVGRSAGVVSVLIQGLSVYMPRRPDGKDMTCNTHTPG